MQESQVDAAPESAEDSGEVEVPESSPTDQEESTAPIGVSTEGLEDAAPDVPKTAEPVVICDLCGPVKGPKAEVFQCQLCMKSFCVQHVDPFFHACPTARQS